MEEIARFLHDHPPFSLLSLEQVQLIARHTQIEYFAAHHDLPLNGTINDRYIYIVRRGSVDLLYEDSQGTRVFDTLDTGECYGFAIQGRVTDQTLLARTREEVLAYLLPEEAFFNLRRSLPEFDRFFAATAAETLDRALNTFHDTTSDMFHTRLRDLVQRSLITVPATDSIHAAAQVMQQHNVSSVVVTDSTAAARPVGIVSDRDLRSKVLAVGLSDTTPVHAIMTPTLVTLPGESLVFEALMLMLERRIHHLPVTEDDRIIGMVTNSDILRQQSKSPLFLPRQIERAVSLADLQAYTSQVEQTVVRMLAEGARVQDIGRVVSVAHTALLQRLLRDAEQRFGPPPCPYAWLVMGSEGRYEQTLRTDQDNALVYADQCSTDAATYFRNLTEHVIEQLMRCGFPQCPGNYMAANPQWRQPLHIWQGYFRHWMSAPDEDALMHASIFFDYRKAYGTLDVETTLRTTVEQARRQQIFLGRMARVALRQSPPLGFFRNFVLEHQGEQRDLIDLKTRGTALIVDMARVYALNSGSTETNTLGRLQSAARHGTISADGAEELSAAFAFISLLRLRHQVQQLARGDAPTNQVPVSSLSRLEQRDLKEALKVIGNMQQSTESVFRTNLLA